MIKQYTYSENQVKAGKLLNKLYPLNNHPMHEVRAEVKRLVGIAVANGGSFKVVNDTLQIRYCGFDFEVKSVNGICKVYFDEEDFFSKEESEAIYRSEMKAEYGWLHRAESSGERLDPHGYEIERQMWDIDPQISCH